MLQVALVRAGCKLGEMRDRLRSVKTTKEIGIMEIASRIASGPFKHKHNAERLYYTFFTLVSENLMPCTTSPQLSAIASVRTARRRAP